MSDDPFMPDADERPKRSRRRTKGSRTDVEEAVEASAAESAAEAPLEDDVEPVLNAWDAPAPGARSFPRRKTARRGSDGTSAEYTEVPVEYGNGDVYEAIEKAQSGIRLSAAASASASAPQWKELDLRKVAAAIGILAVVIWLIFWGIGAARGAIARGGVEDAVMLSEQRYGVTDMQILDSAATASVGESYPCIAVADGRIISDTCTAITMPYDVQQYPDTLHDRGDKEGTDYVLWFSPKLEERSAAAAAAPAEPAEPAAAPAG